MLGYLQNVNMPAVIRRDEAGEEGKSYINLYSASEELAELVLPKISSSENASVIYFNMFIWFKG